jgi:hypothetical protein
VALERLSMYWVTAGAASSKPRFLRAEVRRTAAASSAAKALTDALPKATNLLTAKTPMSCLPNLPTAFSSPEVALPASVKAFLPTNSAAISTLKSYIIL